MEIPERIWFLMSKNLGGDASPQEVAELMDALQQQPDLMQQYELLQRLWKPANAEQQQPPEAGKINRILQLAAVEPAEQEEENVIPLLRYGKWRSVGKWAAIVAGLSVGVWGFSRWYNQSAGIDTANSIIAQKGSKTRTILPDGSTVWLNAGSRIVYEPGFTEDLREVSLEGEAYFDVVKQPNRPFIVHAGNINIRVLGTAFNVKSYKEDKTIETTLIRGLVQITRSDNAGQEPIYLHPNQKIVLPVAREKEEVATPNTAKENSHVNLSKVVYIDSTLKEDQHIETAWVYNRLQFRGDSFEELSKKLERWYNINIHFSDEEAKQLTFNGSLENETVEEAFHALQAAVPFNFEIKNNDIYIKTVSPGRLQ